MHNVNIKDQVKQTLESQFIVGSECINWFGWARNESTGGALVLLDKLSRGGTAAIFDRAVPGTDNKILLVITGGKTFAIVVALRSRSIFH